MGVTQPTLVQAQYIPPILSGKDVIIRSQTGSGKTLGIVTSVVEKTLKQGNNESRKGPHTVIITPTRELAWQITMWIRTLLQSVYQEQTNLNSPQIDPKNSVQMLVGGVPISQQMSKLSQHNPQIIVATSTRLKDIIDKTPSLTHNTEQATLPFSDKKTQDIIATPQNEHTIELPQTQTLPKHYTPLPKTTPQKSSYKNSPESRDSEIPPNFRFSFKSMNTLIVDEVDLVVNSLSRYATEAQYKSHKKHPPIGTLLLDHIKSDVAKSPNEQNRYQTIISSATVNSRTRSEIKKNRWMRDDPFFVDVGSPFTIPHKIEHKWIVVQKEEDIIKAIKHCYQLAKSGGESTNNDNDNNNNNNDTTIIKNEGSNDKSNSNINNASENNTNNTNNNTNSIQENSDSEKRFSALILMDGMASYKGLLRRMLREKLSVGGLAYAINYDENNQQEQEEDETPFEEFMSGKLEFLAASETSIRGLDIPNLTHVFILGAFYDANSYLHMAGRTGRMGQAGKVISIFTEEQLPKIALEMKYIQLDFKPENLVGEDE
eukprot:TRINITY_DN1536_c0_g1_i1.p1 TRINITY_DN1536_c0_g1~~TRINITY_DN1536_c0_g1_i1.p1  ORF type:complete len:632 (-),score=146.49 TRINITY_DN1536_c0_g1_i1:2-1633(-)